jgi:spermidine/putrescine transport system permease protein
VSGGRWSGVVLNVYLALFYVYLFAPLVIMSLAAFNDYPYPSVTQWQGWTLKWFPALLADERMWQGAVHSLLIAAGVVGLSLPLGLAGALILTRLESRWSGPLYAVMVSPILTPGIILGISTLVFWGRLGLGAGLLTAILAQTTFIAAYAMLLFMARLQRQDRALEEAALDLGASSFLVFRRITLPFLAPTILTAAVIGLLQSLENYNTTMFSIGGSWTLVTEIGARFRFGLSPVINVIGLAFVALTVVFASIYVLVRYREREVARRA